MTFEEFFKKKKISLQLLQQAEPALFSEFETHYRQMGEKSFDHTKKYWFNQLRRKFPAPPEVKPEKVIIENPIAEQTIADTLTEPATPAPNVGFKPRFKAAMAGKPAQEKAVPEQEPAATEENATPNDQPAPNVGFKPRFKASMVNKPAEEKPVSSQEPAPAEENPVSNDTPAPALGFKPKFRTAAPTKPAQQAAPETMEAKKEHPVDEAPAETAPKPVGFKPRFNAKNIKPKEDGE